MSIHAFGLALGILITRCAPNVGSRTMGAIVSVESGGDPYAIDDDDAHVTYNPSGIAQAISIAERLQSIGHNFDAGIAQINSSNFATEHLSATSVFDPCLNLRAGGDILAHAYQSTKRIPWLGHPPRSLHESHAQEQLALYHAFSTYNSGDPERSLAYARSVVAAATGGFSDSMMARYVPKDEHQPPEVTAKPQKERISATVTTFSTRLKVIKRRSALALAMINFSAIAKHAGLSR